MLWVGTMKPRVVLSLRLGTDQFSVHDVDLIESSLGPQAIAAQLQKRTWTRLSCELRGRARDNQ